MLRLVSWFAGEQPILISFLLLLHVARRLRRRLRNRHRCLRLLIRFVSLFFFFFIVVSFLFFSVWKVRKIRGLVQELQRKVPDLQTLVRRFWKVAAPYWFSDDQFQARLQLATVFALTLLTTGISVGFNFLGRDFFNALASQFLSFFLSFVQFNSIHSWNFNDYIWYIYVCMYIAFLTSSLFLLFLYL